MCTNNSGSCSAGDMELWACPACALPSEPPPQPSLRIFPWSPTTTHPSISLLSISFPELSPELLVPRTLSSGQAACQMLPRCKAHLLHWHCGSSLANCFSLTTPLQQCFMTVGKKAVLLSCVLLSISREAEGVINECRNGRKNE